VILFLGAGTNTLGGGGTLCNFEHHFFAASLRIRSVIFFVLVVAASYKEKRCLGENTTTE